MGLGRRKKWKGLSFGLWYLQHLTPLGAQLASAKRPNSHPVNQTTCLREPLPVLCLADVLAFPSQYVSSSKLDLRSSYASGPVPGVLTCTCSFKGKSEPLRDDFIFERLLGWREIFTTSKTLSHAQFIRL